MEGPLTGHPQRDLCYLNPGNLGEEPLVPTPPPPHIWTPCTVPCVGAVGREDTQNATSTPQSIRKGKPGRDSGPAETIADGCGGDWGRGGRDDSLMLEHLQKGVISKDPVGWDGPSSKASNDARIPAIKIIH